MAGPAEVSFSRKAGWNGSVLISRPEPCSLALATSDVLDYETLPERVREGRAVAPVASGKAAPDEGLPDGLRLDDYLDDIRRRCIQLALEECGGNQTRAAERLEVTFRSLRYYVQKYGLRPGAPSGSGD